MAAAAPLPRRGGRVRRRGLRPGGGPAGAPDPLPGGVGGRGRGCAGGGRGGCGEDGQKGEVRPGGTGVRIDPGPSPREGGLCFSLPRARRGCTTARPPRKRAADAKRPGDRRAVGPTSSQVGGERNSSLRGGACGTAAGGRGRPHRAHPTPPIPTKSQINTQIATATLGQV
ncbi:hypothetical protein CP979_26695 [Streptomyces filamentosus]|nr:hypothetical protein CP979_26695 [Streptomyces filamentosus]